MFTSIILWKMVVILDRMNSVLGVRVISNRRARLLLYSGAVVIVLSLALFYFCAKKSNEVVWRATPPYVNWVRDLHTVDSPEDLREQFTIMDISYMNGRLSAFCALKNIDPTHGISVQITRDSEGLYWSPATLQAGATTAGPWKDIARILGSRDGGAKVLGPGDAITFNVDINRYLTVLQKYKYGRIVTSSGASVTINLALLQPPPKQIPTREEIFREREREVELTPNK
jgi:hypothetical protein